MNAIKEILEFLERYSSFSRDILDQVQGPNWPRGWLTAHQISEELERFQFWTGLRQRIPDATRHALVVCYLKHVANQDENAWVCIDDQYMFNPAEADIQHGQPVTREAEQRRRHGRVACELLSCQFGEIVNLSASGTMIRGKGAAAHQAEDRIGLDLKCLDHQLHLSARIVWLRQDEKTYQMGLEFVDMSPDQAQQIRELLPIAAAVQTVEDGVAHVTHWGK